MSMKTKDSIISPKQTMYILIGGGVAMLFFALIGVVEKVGARKYNSHCNYEQVKMHVKTIYTEKGVRYLNGVLMVSGGQLVSCSNPRLEESLINSMQLDSAKSDLYKPSFDLIEPPFTFYKTTDTTFFVYKSGDTLLFEYDCRE